ncbi:MAG: LysM peptidoglycan-binding domain-containing protein [Algicola sp.]|nr:LysM peptidoglycan-binding domain-containing protein [Algicola sp.]
MKNVNKIGLIGLLCCNPNALAEATSHVIQQGENLHMLSERYKVSVQDLQKFNGIEDVNKVSVGQTIFLVQTTGLVQQAQVALTRKKYNVAIKLLLELTQQGNVEERQFALEFLGVAREKKGQKAWAKQAYQAFISEYPESKHLARVKMRLDNLIGIQTLAKNRTLSKGKGKSKGKTRAKRDYTRGSISMDYRKGKLTNNDGVSRDTLSLLNTDLNAKGYYGFDDYSLGFRVSMGHYQDLLPDSDKTSNRLRYLNASAKTIDDKYKFKIGRQRSRNKGIFGRFDGFVASADLLNDTTFNLYAGYPVASSKVTSLDPERKFYGVSVDIEDSWQNMDFSVFLFEQKINNLTDRRAIGGSARYFKDNVSFVSLLDYDIYFNALNALLLSGSYATESQQRFNWSINYRKSPYVGTRNALIGQAADSMAELQNLFINDEEILDIAQDRSLTSTTVSVGFYQPINDKYDISTDITYMDLSGAPESGGVASISDTGGQYYANVSLGAKHIYSDRDTNRLGFRYSNMATSQVYSMYLSSQYRFENGLSFTPKVRFDSRSNDNGTSQQNISPTFRIQYQTKQHYVYADFGAILYNSKQNQLPDQQTNVYFVYLGYRYYF